MEYSAEDFYALLRWLDPDEQRAAEKYEAIRRRLVQYFVLRQCVDPEELTDETMTRVARRAPEIASSYPGEPGPYFYGVARIVLSDYFRRRPLERLEEQDLVVGDIEKGENREQLYECLDKCMLALPVERRKLLTAYYEQSKQAKIAARRELAAEYGMSLAVLRVRLYKIREALQKCVETCMKSHQQQD